MPVATTGLFFVPMPLTGEAWVREILLHAGGSDVGPLFQPSNEIDVAFRRNRLSFGVIRDPWSWYQALWVRLSEAPGAQVLRHLCRGRATFPAFLKGVTDAEVWMTTPTRLTSLYWPWPVVGSEGLYTETFKHFYGPEVNAFIDYHDLSGGLSEILGVQVSHQQEHEPDNQYTPDLIDMVQAGDGDLADTLNCEPFLRRVAPVWWGNLAE